MPQWQLYVIWNFLTQVWGSHMSDFHNYITQNGSKMCLGSVTCVTCDTTWHGS